MMSWKGVAEEEGLRSWGEAWLIVCYMVLFFCDDDRRIDVHVSTCIVVHIAARVLRVYMCALL